MRIPYLTTTLQDARDKLAEAGKKMAAEIVENEAAKKREDKDIEQVKDRAAILQFQAHLHQRCSSSLRAHLLLFLTLHTHRSSRSTLSTHQSWRIRCHLSRKMFLPGRGLLTSSRIRSATSADSIIFVLSDLSCRKENESGDLMKGVISTLVGLCFAIALFDSC